MPDWQTVFILFVVFIGTYFLNERPLLTASTTWTQMWTDLRTFYPYFLPPLVASIVGFSSAFGYMSFRMRWLRRQLVDAGANPEWFKSREPKDPAIAVESFLVPHTLWYARKPGLVDELGEYKDVRDLEVLLSWNPSDPIKIIFTHNKV